MWVNRYFQLEIKVKKVPNELQEGYTFPKVLVVSQEE